MIAIKTIIFTRYLFFWLLLTLFYTCEHYHGKPVPLGDEFEDHWNRMDWPGTGISHIEPSKINAGEFFIISEKEVWQIQDTIVKNEIFSKDIKLTCLAGSFILPQKLLIGTETSSVYIVSLAGGTSVEISVPYLSSISFVAFSPNDVQTFYVGDSNLILRTVDSGNFFDSLFYSPNRIVNIIVSPSGKFFIATNKDVFLSTDQGNTWDTIYTSTNGNINRITVDKTDNIYLAEGAAVLISKDQIQWNIIFDSLGEHFSFAQAESGLVVANYNYDEVRVDKITQAGQSFEISLGIVFESHYDDNAWIIITANQNEYLLTFGSFEEYEATSHSFELFYFYDSELPP